MCLSSSLSCQMDISPPLRTVPVGPVQKGTRYTHTHTHTHTRGLSWTSSSSDQEIFPQHTDKI